MEACCAEAAVGGEHVKECWAVPRGREERAALQCLFGNLTQLATFLSVCEIGHLSLFALWHFFFRAVFWGTPAVLVMYAAGVGSSGQSKTNTPLSLSLSLSQESASASSHAERTQQRSECGRSPGASAPTTASPVSRIAAPYQSTLSLSGNVQPNRQLSIFYFAVTFRTHIWYFF